MEKSRNVESKTVAKSDDLPETESVSGSVDLDEHLAVVPPWEKQFSSVESEGTFSSTTSELDIPLEKLAIKEDVAIKEDFQDILLKGKRELEATAAVKKVVQYLLDETKEEGKYNKVEFETIGKAKKKKDAKTLAAEEMLDKLSGEDSDNGKDCLWRLERIRTGQNGLLTAVSSLQEYCQKFQHDLPLYVEGPACGAMFSVICRFSGKLRLRGNV
ncbi:unnamed protein product [Notodromas monacha]|uniref:Uncharacterized protein n=1 Tax=Notodromas monacha TaxID=399045 RepID=A0A7R9BKK0_9CRUS|nr:unnamed protein product [Notodromas monacha]CAG0915852.1 unnamed protein product [Notodromas monacha]